MAPQDPSNAPKGLPAPWAPYAQRPIPARVEGLLIRAAAALPSPGSPQEALARTVELRVVGLTLEAELRAMASRVGGGMALHAKEADLCAVVLAAVGETAKAALLLKDAGLLPHAAQVAERAGELDVLLTALDKIHLPQEQAHAAALAFKRYEGHLGAGQLGAALGALQQAAGARPDNLSYRDLLQGFQARRPRWARFSLRPLGAGVPLTVALAPCAVGRSEDAWVRWQAPGVSRHHFEVTLHPGRAALRHADGGVLWEAVLGNGDRLETVRSGRAALEVQGSLQGVLLQSPGVLDARVVALGQPVGWRHDVSFTLVSWPQGGFPGLMIHGTAWSVMGSGPGAQAVELALGDRLEVASLGRFTVEA